MWAIYINVIYINDMGQNKRKEEGLEKSFLSRIVMAGLCEQEFCSKLIRKANVFYNNKIDVLESMQRAFY